MRYFYVRFFWYLRKATLTVALCALACSNVGYGKSRSPSTREVPSAELPVLQVDQNLQSKLYQQSVDNDVRSTEHAPLHFSLSLRVHSPQVLTLHNRYFEVAYASQQKSIPAVAFEIATPLESFGGYDLNLHAETGFAYAQGVYDVQAEGLKVKDEIELQWIPVLAGVSLERPRVVNSSIGAAAFTNAGVDWLTQNGRLDGDDQTFWLPRWQAGGALFLTDRTAERSAKLTVSYYQGILRSQPHRGMIFGVGATHAF